jgi:hypothetical protein
MQPAAIVTPCKTGKTLTLTILVKFRTRIAKIATKNNPPPRIIPVNVIPVIQLITGQKSISSTLICLIV